MSRPAPYAVCVRPVLASILVGALALPAVARGTAVTAQAQPRDTSGTILMVVSRWWPGRSPCAEDQLGRGDTVWIRVRAGEAIWPTHWREARFPGFFHVRSVIPDSEVVLEPPNGIAAEPEQRTEFGDAIIRVGWIEETLAGGDAGGLPVGLSFRVIRQLWEGAVLGIEPRPMPPTAYDRQFPRIVERHDPTWLPPDDAGPWGVVGLQVMLDAEGEFDHAVVTRHRSTVCDAAAITAVRHWTFRAGIPCRGFIPRRTLDVEVHFAAPPRAGDTRR